MQKRFVRFALYTLPWNNPVALPPYSTRLQLVNSLLNFKVNCPFLYDKISSNVNRYILRNNNIFTLHHCHSNYAKNEATVRMRALANNCTPSFSYDISVDCLKKTL